MLRLVIQNQKAARPPLYKSVGLHHYQNLRTLVKYGGPRPGYWTSTRAPIVVRVKEPYIPLGSRALSGGFFDQLKKSLQKEVEQNKEFKESLSKLRKETSDLSEKAQEKLKVGTEAKQYAEGLSSKSKEALESAKSFLGGLKEKVLPPKPTKEQADVGTVKSKATAEDVKPRRKRAGPIADDGAADNVKDTATKAQTQGKAESSKTSTSSEPFKEKKEAGRAQAKDYSGTDSFSAKDQGDASSTSSSSTTGAGETAEQQKASESTSWSERILQGRDLPTALKAWGSNLYTEVQEAAVDLFGMKEQSTGMKKRIYEPAPAGKSTAEGDAEEGKDDAADGKPAAKPSGGGALVVVKVSDGYWFADQLKDAPLIKEILKAGKQFANTELGKKAHALRGKVHDKVEDAREMWETSQNPLVYKLSSMWDDLTSETELGVALKEIRRSDPEFVMEDWVNNISERFLPMFFESYLRGDLKALAPYLSEGMYKSLAEEFRMRKAEGLVLDPNILEISNTEVLQAKITDGSPMLMVGTLIQHINCVRNRDGAIVDGKEDEVRASFYLLLFTRSFNETDGVLEWKIAERMLGMSERYI